MSVCHQNLTDHDTQNVSDGIRCIRPVFIPTITPHLLTQ